MVRMVFIAILLVIGAIAIWKTVQMIRTRQIDWTGVAFAAGFIALAIYLRTATGVGGIAEG